MIDTLLSLADFAAAVLPFPLTALHLEILDVAKRFGILNCHRRFGKTSLIATRAAWTALSQPDSVTLVVAATQNQAEELVARAATYLDKVAIPYRRDPRNGIRLANGSRILALPNREESIRGYSADLILIDEAAFVPDETFEALPILASSRQPSLWLLSTPRGKAGFFYEIWISSDPTWARIRASAGDATHLDPFILEASRARGAAHYAREYLCEFSAGSESLFNPDLLRRAVRPRPATSPVLHIFHQPRPRYLIGVDLGLLQDHSAYAVIEVVRRATGQRNPATWEPIYDDHLALIDLERIPLRTPYPVVARALADLTRRPDFQGNCRLAVDVTNSLAFLDLLRNERPQATICPVTIGSAGTGQRHGLTYHCAQSDLMLNLAHAFYEDQLYLSSHLTHLPALLEELTRFERFTTSSGRYTFRAATGHDDLVNALALATWKPK